MSRLTTFLIANPSFLNGAAHILDFWGTYDSYNQSLTTEEADARAIFSDWRSVGEELMLAVDKALVQQRGETP